MAVTFLDQYLQAPQTVRDFIYSYEYYQLLEKYLEKFEIDPSREVIFVYLIQDLVFKVFVPKSIMELKDEIKSRLELSEEISNQLAYILFNELLPKINQLWQEEKTKKEIFESQNLELIKKIEEVKKKTKPTRILNLKKILPHKKEEVKPAVDLQKLEQKEKIEPLSEPRIIKIQIPQIESSEMKPSPEKIPASEEININIPSSKTEALVSTSWNEKKGNEEKEEKTTSEETSKIVIIKKEQPTQRDEGVIDLSSY